MAGEQLDATILDALFRFAPMGFAVVDADKRYVRINDEFAAMNGAPASEHLGRTPREVIPAIAEAVESVIDHVLQTKLPLTDVEVPPPASAGMAEAVVRVSLYPLLDGETAVGVLAIARGV